MRRMLRTFVLTVFSATLVIHSPVETGAVPAEGHRIMYAGPSPWATEIVREIHRKGGNVVDATVAVALSLAVTAPYYGSLGGGGFAVVKMGTEIKALDFREVAPARADENLYLDKPANASVDGGLAVGIPGVPAGLWEMHKRHGKLKWNQLFDGAIRLAEDGFLVSGEWVRLTNASRSRFNPEGLKLVTAKDGAALKPGDRLRQPQLARLLRDLRQQGPKAFYEGAVAQDILSTVNGSGGVFTAGDLKNYSTRWLEPLRANYRGYTLHLMPPPSSGGVVIAQALNLMERVKIHSYEPLSVDELHHLIEVMKLSFRGRSRLGDPDFTKNPVDELLGEEAISKMAGLIKKDRAIEVEKLKEPPQEQQNTTHFSIVDSKGNAVSLTTTLNGNWGSGLITPKFGVALNNEMDDFTTRPGQPNMFGLIQGESNKVRAGARPLSSMSPTIVEKDGQTVLALGSPGGPRIITGVLQVFYRSMNQSFDIDQAIQAPRVHHQFLPNTVYTDALKLPPETLTALRQRGHKIETGSTAKVYGVVKTLEGILQGAADARGEGASGGY
jgi:gamma-glutamyltranspeptidase / glutathione hydrolase